MVSFHFFIKTVHTALRFFRRLRCPLPLLFAAPRKHILNICNNSYTGLVRKLQSLLKKEFADGIIAKDPDDLEPLSLCLLVV